MVACQLVLHMVRLAVARLMYVVHVCLKNVIFDRFCHVSLCAQVQCSVCYQTHYSRHLSIIPRYLCTPLSMQSSILVACPGKVAAGRASGVKNGAMMVGR